MTQHFWGCWLELLAVQEDNNSLVSAPVSNYFPQSPEDRPEQSQTETSEHMAEEKHSQTALVHFILLHFFFNVYYLQQTAVSPAFSIVSIYTLGWRQASTVSCSQLATANYVHRMAPFSD